MFSSTYKFIVAVLFVQLLGSSAFARTETSFSADEFESLSPFSLEVQKQVLRDILALMKIEEDPEKPFPKVLISQDVDLEESRELIAEMEAQGVPGWALERGFNIYVRNKNTILIGRNQKIHNLAHELTHYVQVEYQNYKTYFGSADLAESDASDMQKNFKL